MLCIYTRFVMITNLQFLCSDQLYNRGKELTGDWDRQIRMYVSVAELCQTTV